MPSSCVSLLLFLIGGVILSSAKDPCTVQVLSTVQEVLRPANDLPKPRSSYIYMCKCFYGVDNAKNARRFPALICSPCYLTSELSIDYPD